MAKVGFKARRGRKRNPVPHKQHRKRGATRDPMESSRRRYYRRLRQPVAPEIDLDLTA